MPWRSTAREAVSLAGESEDLREHQAPRQNRAGRRSRTDAGWLIATHPSHPLRLALALAVLPVLALVAAVELLMTLAVVAWPALLMRRPRGGPLPRAINPVSRAPEVAPGRRPAPSRVGRPVRALDVPSGRSSLLLVTVPAFQLRIPVNPYTLSGVFVHGDGGRVAADAEPVVYPLFFTSS